MSNTHSPFATLKSIDYNLAMTFILNNNNNNISTEGQKIIHTFI